MIVMILIGVVTPINKILQVEIVKKANRSGGIATPVILPKSIAFHKAVKSYELERRTFWEKEVILLESYY
jgi:hypothetical protein